ncbi:MAG TPA: CHC2 zinc finger domain-containing protein [Puia sp.]
MEQEQSLYQRAQTIDLVDYLSNLGHIPQKIKEPDYWFLSPFRNERTASFKVNRKRNIWYDHGMGKGGNLIEFGKLYFNCSFEEFMNRLDDLPSKSFSFHNPSLPKESPKISESSIIQVKDQRVITDPELISYLRERCIDLEIASRYCSEIDFELYGRTQTAIGFQNDLGGYELRNRDFKGSSSPKSPTTIINQTERLSVFEGFFDFLSYQTNQIANKETESRLTKVQDSFLILNSLAYLEKTRVEMERYPKIHLYLDRDKAGREATKKALSWSGRYIDKSHSYRLFKDLNESLCHCKGGNLKCNRGRHL